MKKTKMQRKKEGKKNGPDDAGRGQRDFQTFESKILDCTGGNEK